MPGKNILKEYLENGIYHIYNRGINKQDIFLDDRDYSYFLFYLKLYLDSPENLKDIDPQKRRYLSRKNFYERINLLCYCLMPNHFHLIIKQKGEKDIAEFIKCFLTNYSMYFNKRYKRLGPLFQGTYKAILVKDDSYLLHLSRYIHLNPIDFTKGAAKGYTLGSIEKYPYSSLPNYLGKKITPWVNPEIILEYFEDNKEQGIIDKTSYQRFIKEYEYDYDSKKIIGDLVLEDLED